MIDLDRQHGEIVGHCGLPDLPDAAIVLVRLAEVLGPLWSLALVAEVEQRLRMPRQVSSATSGRWQPTVGRGLCGCLGPTAARVSERRLAGVAAAGGGGNVGGAMADSASGPTVE